MRICWHHLVLNYIFRSRRSELKQLFKKSARGSLTAMTANETPVLCGLHQRHESLESSKIKLSHHQNAEREVLGMSNEFLRDQKQYSLKFERQKMNFI